MANRIDRHYDEFIGIDTRSNRLNMNPKNLGKGSKNNRFSFEDENAKRYGFQHKDSESFGCEAGVIEYKFKDLEDGQAKSQILGVGSDGNLRKKVSHIFQLTKSGGTAETYSVYYDEVLGLFVLEIKSSSAVLFTKTFDNTYTLDQLKTDVNNASITGLSCDVVDDNGSSVTSPKLAYLMDCVIDGELSADNPVWFWELVPTASSSVPFPNIVSQASNVNYEGITYVNQNNAVYITDGGFPFKYDGKSLFRAGMPASTNDQLMNQNSIIVANIFGGLDLNAEYKYIVQFGNVDYNGVEVLGKIVDLEFFKASTAGSGFTALSFNIPKIGNVDATNDLFPVYSCTIDGNQTVTKASSGTFTITVQSGHNIVEGMCLRIPLMNLQVGNYSGWSFAYFKVVAVTATTIECEHINISGSSYDFPSYDVSTSNPFTLRNSSSTVSVAAGALRDGFVINGCFVPSYYEGFVNKFTNTGVPGRALWHPEIIYGSFARIYRSEGGGSVFYRLADVGVSHQADTSVLDALNDDNIYPTTVLDFGTGATDSLSRIPADFTLGEEIPRACRYLSEWQEQIMQAGRPYDPSLYLDKTYPVLFLNPPSADTAWGLPFVFPVWKYNENFLCDFQSVYWESDVATEGFPQSGLFENSCENAASDEIRGLAPNKEAFFVFKERTTAYMRGDLAQNNLITEFLETDVGCVSHKTICDVDGTLVFLDQDKGFHSVIAGRLPVNIGYQIQDYFKTNQQTKRFNLRSANATNLRIEDQYICYIGGNEPTFFVYDYRQKGWILWDGLEASGGVLGTSLDEMIIADTTTWKQKRTGTKYDYSDHTSGIACLIKSAWLNYGYPSIDKGFVQICVNSVKGGFDLRVLQYGNYDEAAFAEINLQMPLPPKKTTKLITQSNRNVKYSGYAVGFYNDSVNQPMTINGYEIQYAPDYDIGEIKR